MHQINTKHPLNQYADDLLRFCSVVFFSQVVIGYIADKAVEQNRSAELSLIGRKSLTGRNRACACRYGAK